MLLSTHLLFTILTCAQHWLPCFLGLYRLEFEFEFDMLKEYKNGHLEQ